MNETNPNKKSALEILNDFMNRDNNDLLSEQGIALLHDGLWEIEQRGVAAMIVAGKSEIRGKVDDAVTLDIFMQGLKIVQRCNRVFSLSNAFMVAKQIANEDMCNALRGVITIRFGSLLDRDTAIVILMKSVIHLLHKNNGVNVPAASELRDDND